MLHVGERRDTGSDTFEVYMRAVELNDFKAVKPKSMSNEATTTHYIIYQGPLGLIVHRGGFFASKDGFPIGTYNTFEEAMESLVWKERPKAN